MRPAPPFVALGPRGEIYVCDSDEPLRHASLYGVVRGFFAGLQAFDREGMAWRVQEVEGPYRITFLTKLLARTLYNPRFSVHLRWREDGRYQLPQLQDAICHAVDQDDDVSTQFISAERLKKVVRLSRSFDELVDKLRKHRAA